MITMVRPWFAQRWISQPSRFEKNARSSRTGTHWSRASTFLSYASLSESQALAVAQELSTGCPRLALIGDVIRKQLAILRGNRYRFLEMFGSLFGVFFWCAVGRKAGKTNEDPRFRYAGKLAHNFLNELLCVWVHVSSFLRRRGVLSPAMDEGE